MLTQERIPEGTVAEWASDPRCIWKGVELTGRYPTLLIQYPRPVATEELSSRQLGQCTESVICVGHQVDSWPKDGGIK